MAELFVTCFLLSVLVNILFHKFFIKNNWIDKINSRSSHKKIATRSSGIAIFTSLFILSVSYYLFGYELYEYNLLVPLSLLAMIGVYDDVNNIDFRLKFIFQIIAAKIIVDNGLIISNLHGFLGVFEISNLFAQLLTITIIVAIVNAINFIDGLDGLAISVVSVFVLLFEFLSKDFFKFDSLSIILIALILPLFYFNYKKENKSFLGDSGSLFLGGIASIYVVSILSNEYIIKSEFDLNKIIYVISLLPYPIIDIVRVFFIRISNGKSPFIADKNHIHHIIFKKVNSHFYTVLIIISGSLLILILSQIVFN